MRGERSPGVKPARQRNLGRETGRRGASQNGDYQHHKVVGGKQSEGRSTSGEVLIKAVMFNRPKMLTGLNQKVSGQVQGL